MEICEERQEPWSEDDDLPPCNVGDGEELIISMLSEPQRVRLLSDVALERTDLALV